MPTARTTGRGAATPSSERISSRVVMTLRISTIASSLFGPQRLLYRTPFVPSARVLMDQVDLVDVFLVNAWELSGDSSSVTLSKERRKRDAPKPLHPQTPREVCSSVSSRVSIAGRHPPACVATVNAVETTTRSPCQLWHPRSASQYLLGRQPGTGCYRRQAMYPEDVDPESGCRLPLPKREQLDDAGQRTYDSLADPKGGTIRG